jgi:hypothetical protein
MPLSNLAALAQRKGGSLVSLQKGEAERQLDAVAFGEHVIPLGPLLHDMADTAAAIRGFVRGLGFVGNDLLVGLSLPRQHRDFSGLPLDDRLKETGQAPQCMIQVIDLNSGTAAHSIALGGVVRELYDITCIPNTRTPMVVGFAQDQINRLIQRGPDVSIAELLAERTR